MDDSEDQNARGATTSGRTTMTSRLPLVAAFATVYLVWGSTYLGIKYAVETIPPMTMAGARFLVAGSVLYAWSSLRGRRGGDRARLTAAHWRAAIVAGALMVLCGNGGVTWAETRIPSGLAAIFVATEPFWIVLLNWWRPSGVRPRAQVWVGLVVGLAGVALLVGIGSPSHGVDPLAAAAVLGAAVAWAAGSLYSARGERLGSPALASGMQMLAGGGMLLLAGAATGEWSRFDVGRVSVRSLLGFAYLVAFGSIVAFTTYTWILRVASQARAATYAYVNPAVAVFLGWLVAGEAITTRTLVGSAVIVASVALIVSTGERERAPEPDAEPERAPIQTSKTEEVFQ